jgi:hypothetical protein
MLKKIQVKNNPMFLLKRSFMKGSGPLIYAMDKENKSFMIKVKLNLIHQLLANLKVNLRQNMMELGLQICLTVLVL